MTTKQGRNVDGPVNQKLLFFDQLFLHYNRAAPTLLLIRQKNASEKTPKYFNYSEPTTLQLRTLASDLRGCTFLELQPPTRHIYSSVTQEIFLTSVIKSNLIQERVQILYVKAVVC